MTNAGKGADDGYTDVCLLSLLHLLDGVAFHHVSDLVPQRAGELVQTIGALNESAVDIDIPAGKRKSVDLPRIHDIEMPVEISPAGLARERFAEVLDVTANGGIVDDRELRVYFLGVLATQLDLLILGDGAGAECGEAKNQRIANHLSQGNGRFHGGQDMFQPYSHLARKRNHRTCRQPKKEAKI